jgi:hypothetical protein
VTAVAESPLSFAEDPNRYLKDLNFQQQHPGAHLRRARHNRYDPSGSVKRQGSILRAMCGIFRGNPCYLSTSSNLAAGDTPQRLPRDMAFHRALN